MEALYGLSQQATCQTIITLWNNCKNHIGPMQAFKSLYSIPYCDQQITAALLAEAMPDEAARAMVHKMLRMRLLTEGRICTTNWGSLKLYINGIYAGSEEREVQHIGAGWNYYENAANDNWSDLDKLMQDGYNYITNNEDALMGEDGTNMPETFPDAFHLSWTKWKATWDAFIQAENSSNTGGADKVSAINDCYRLAIDMGADGQHVFKDDEEVQKQFSFTAVGEMVAPSGPASYEVTVEVDGAAKAGAEVSIEGTDKKLITNAEGKALFLQMHEGPLKCLVECDGYTQQLVSETLTAGVRKRVTVTLKPLFSGEFEVGSETVSSPSETVSSPQAAVGSSQ